jgi:hypothetical protein
MIWLTSDVPFDIDMFNEISAHNLRLQNFNDEFQEKVKQFGGLPLMVESEIFLKGSSYNSTEKVVEIQKKDPPADIYSPPAGFTKKEKLSLDDIRG